jgi:pyruvate/2-oxoglutarate dehydrogenase complex dihydrolipoamide dehydrogenase (E3) component
VPDGEREWTADVAVIGGGAGAWTALRVARSLDKRVVLFEEHELGGTCVNVGCIPTKALVRSAEVVDTVRHATHYGLAVEGFRVDFPAVMARMHGIVQQSRSFYERAIATDPGVVWVPEHARFTAPNALEWSRGALTVEQIILATGTEGHWPDIPGIREAGIDSTGMLALDTLPERLIVLGGGVIATEFAQIMARLGSRVTMVARGGTILRGVDPDAVDVVEEALRRDGVRLLCGAQTREARRNPEGWVELEITRADGMVETLLGDAMLVATGRRPKIEGLALEAAGIELDPQTRGPRVDAELRTTNPRVYAVGDALGRQLYTHVANHEGPYAAKNLLLGAHLTPDFYDEVPGAIFCDPELANVGMGQREAEERGFEAVTGTYWMKRNGRARAIGKDRGFVRLTVERGTARILGATFVCHDAANALQEVLVAMAGDGTIRAIRKAIHTHPTIVEAVNACARELEARL